jgi:hypothetical protein
VAIESWSCFSLWKLNQKIISYVRPDTIEEGKVFR